MSCLRRYTSQKQKSDKLEPSPISHKSGNYFSFKETLKMQINKWKIIFQAARGSRERNSSTRTTSTQESSPKASRIDIDEDSNMVVKDSEDRASSSSSSSTRRRDARRDSEDSRRSEEAICESKKARLDDDATPRLRLNASLATDPALRPATVAALTIKPENISPPNQTPPLPVGLQNGKAFHLKNKQFKSSI